MPGNLDSPGSLDMPGCLWRQCQLAKTPTTWSGRAQRRTPKARPQGEAAQTMPSTQSATARPSRKHRSNTSGLQNEPFRNHPDTLPTQNRTKEIHPTTNFSCQVAQHRYGAVYASPQIWTCLRLPTDMDLSMPPRRYGPGGWVCGLPLRLLVLLRLPLLLQLPHLPLLLLQPAGHKYIRRMGVRPRHSWVPTKTLPGASPKTP